MKVFLGGTVNGSKWRKYVEKGLKIDYFDPEVPVWTEEAMKRELYERENCDFCLYVITPKMTGFYSIAEVVDDSYKKNDKTLFCYLKTDEDAVFSDDDIIALEQIKKNVLKNGAQSFDTLDQVVEYLNSAADRQIDLQSETKSYKNVFVSYGRRHSSCMAALLVNQLEKKGYSVWFDKNNIPLGVDFQEQIDTGIRHADNFVFIISPHSVKSIYCAKELVLAKKYNKRIIPVMHIEPVDCWDKVDPVINRLNWINARQIEDFSIPLQDWKNIDNPEVCIKAIADIIEQNKPYIRLHTVLLDKALEWEQNHYSPQLLLKGKKRIEAMNWLNTKNFFDECANSVLPPCMPCDIQCKYIVKSRRSAELNLQDVFLCSAAPDTEIIRSIETSLDRSCITSCLDADVFSNSADPDEETIRAVAGSDNFVFILSKSSLQSKRCDMLLNLASQFEKRIICLPIENIDSGEIPPKLVNAICVMFTDRRTSLCSDNEADVIAVVNSRREKSPFAKAMDELKNHLYEDKEFYYTAKKLFVEATSYSKFKSDGLCLTGFRLDRARAWIKLAAAKNYHVLPEIDEYIHESVDKQSVIKIEVYISYHDNDVDAAMRIENDLRVTGKGCSTERSDGNKFLSDSINFVRLVSDDYFNNVNCQNEVVAAKGLGKRIINVLFSDASDNLKTVFAENYYVNLDRHDISSGFSELLRILDNDRDYITNHSKYVALASQWEANDFDDSFLLRGREMLIAEAWLKDVYGIAEDEDLPDNYEALSHLTINKNPMPVKSECDFIIAGKQFALIEAAKEKQRNDKMLALETERAKAAETRLAEQKAATRRTHILTVFLFVLFVSSLITGIWAISARHDAVAKKLQIEVEKENAEKAKKMAEESRQNALHAFKEAYEAKSRSDSMLAVVNKSNDLLEQKQKEALLARNAAIISQKLALDNEARAITLMKSLVENEDVLGFIAGDEDLSAINIDPSSPEYFSTLFYRNGVSSMHNDNYDKSVFNFSFAQFIVKSPELKQHIQDSLEKAQKLLALSSKAAVLASDSADVAAFYKLYCNILRINPTEYNKECADWYSTEEGVREYVKQNFLPHMIHFDADNDFSTFSVVASSVNSDSKTIGIKSFDMLSTEVTNEIFRDFLNLSDAMPADVKNKIKDSKFIFDPYLQYWYVKSEYLNYPVEGVSIDLIQKFCNFFKFTLPSVAYWEYAAQTLSANSDFDLSKISWNKQNLSVNRQFPSGIRPVASGLPLNGSYDMFGNVWEYCSDSYDANLLTDLKLQNVTFLTRAKSKYIAVRGGSVNSPKTSLYPQYQGFADYHLINRKVGFRVIIIN